MCPICSQGDAARREPCFRPIQRAQPLSPPEQRRSESTSSSWPTKVEHRTPSRSSQTSAAGASCKPIADFVCPDKSGWAVIMCPANWPGMAGAAGLMPPHLGGMLAVRLRREHDDDETAHQYQAG